MKYLVFLISVLSILTSCKKTVQHADLLIHNGTVYQVDHAFSQAEVMVVKNGKILDIGSNRLLSAYTADDTIDLKGKFVYPGFIDAHCHFFGYSMNLRQVNLRGTKSFEEILEKLKEWDKKHNAQWILGRGWDQNDWPEKDFPVNTRLDERFPEKPVFLRRIDGHAAIANTKALEIAGITAKTKVNGGSVIARNGKPTGVLIDNAMELVSQHISQSPRKAKVQYLQKAAENCYAVGLTTIADAGLPYNNIRLMDSLQKNKELKMQVYAMLSPTEENFQKFMKQGIYRTPYMHVQSVKMFADGALGSRGACLLAPYSDDPANKGLIVTEPDKMKRIAKKAYQNNYQVNTHAIGDSANRLVLQIYQSILPPDNDRRWRVEHAQVVHPDDIDIFGKYNIVPAINTTHATSDMYWAKERLGAERIPYAYAYNDLLQQNGWLCNGSDFPVEDINPLYGFYAGVARQDNEGYPQNGFQPANAISRQAALKAMTFWAAKSIFEEHEKGSLEKGKNADFVVLQSDLMKAKLKDIYYEPVEMTFIQGERVYKK